MNAILKPYPWGSFAGQYTHDVTWKGVPLTVECDVDDEQCLPVRVLHNGGDITGIVDKDDGEFCDLVQAAHDNRYSTNRAYEL